MNGIRIKRMTIRIFIKKILVAEPEHTIIAA
jgi:hypothetical protein